MQPQAKDHLGLPGSGRGQVGSYSVDFRGNMALPTPGCQTAGHQNWDSKLPLLWQPWETDTVTLDWWTFYINNLVKTDNALYQGKLIKSSLGEPLSVKHLPSAQVMISRSWDWAPESGYPLSGEPVSPSPSALPYPCSCSLSLFFLSQINKYNLK